MKLNDRLIVFLEYLTLDLLRLIQLFHSIFLSPLNLKSVSYILAARHIRYVN